MLCGCEKKPFDHRNKYIGKWDFDVVIDEFNMSSGTTFHDEVSYSGRIKYGDADDEIIIQYTENHSVILKVNEDEELTGFPTQYCSGEMSGKKDIHIYLRYGGLGGGSSYDIDGRKK